MATKSDRAKLPPEVPGRRLRNLIARLRDSLGLYSWLHREYGTIVRYRVLNFEFCILSSPELIEEVLYSKRASFEKGFLYKRSVLLERPAVTTADGEEHHRKRRHVQPYFHRNMLRTYSSVMAEQAVAMRDGWRDGQTLDMYKVAHGLTLANSLKIFFGGLLQLDTETLQRMTSLITIDFGLSMVIGRGPRRWILPVFRRRHRAYRKMREHVEIMVESARADETDRSDFVTYMARITDEDGGYAYSKEEVGDGAFEMVVSSEATTGVALTWATYYLAQYPAARERLEREVDETLGGRVPTLDDCEHLPYTRAVIDEVLRLAPPAYYIGRKAIQDCIIGDYFIPVGANVQLFYFLAQRDERYFPQGDAFRPEFWLAAQPERPRCAYMPFGAGNRSCAAEDFARVTMTFALASIAQRWRLDLVSKEFPKLKTLASFDFKNGLSVVARARNNGS